MENKPKVLTLIDIEKALNKALPKEKPLGQVGDTGLYYLGNGVYGGKGAWIMFNECIKAHTKLIHNDK